MMAERNISLSNWPGIAFFGGRGGGVCGRAHVGRPRVLIFKQHLSSPLHQRLLTLHSQCQLASGQQPPQWSTDNRIPVVELVIKHTHRNTCTHGRKVTVRASDSFGQTGLQIALRCCFSSPITTGGQVHARLSCSRQMSPDKRIVGLCVCVWRGGVAWVSMIGVWGWMSYTGSPQLC